MPCRPMPGKVLVKILEEEKKIAGLVIPELKSKDKEPLLQAEVVSVGRYVERASPGDHVLVKGYAGRWVDESVFGDKSTYRILEEDEMIACVTSGCSSSKCSSSR